MIKVYGSRHCPDCINFEHNLNKNGLEFEFVDINENMPNLKAFLNMRDNNPAFEKTIKYGYVGIPAIVYEDGSVDLHWKNGTLRAFSGEGRGPFPAFQSAPILGRSVHGGSELRQ